MKKAIIFHAFVLMVFSALCINFSVLSAGMLLTGIIGLYMTTSNMTRDELHTVSGANFYNKVFNTTSFTKE